MGVIMKKKKALIIILVVILIGAVGAVAYLALNDKKEAETTEPSQSQSVQSTSQTQTQTQTQQTTAETKADSTIESTTKDKAAFIKKGCWYYADKENEICFAFAFNDNNNADVAMFGSDNIEGFDAQYFKGDAKYEISQNKIIFKKLPASMGVKSIELEITENSIKYNSEKLKNFDEISLDNALKCF